MAKATPIFSFDSCWFDAPQEKSTEFFPTFVRVSMALQAELRRLLPERYLSGLKRFEDILMVYPLLVYSASRPFPGQPRTDFTYDILNRKMMSSFYFFARQELPTLLAPIFQRLRAAGRDDVAACYSPDESKRIVAAVQRVKKMRRRLYNIVMMEGRMVNDLIAFAGVKELPSRMQLTVASRCRRRLLTRLRHIYAKYDFTPWAQEIIERITPALKNPFEPPINADERR